MPEQEQGPLAEFLRSRRLRLKPQEVGLAAGRRRRTPGLRREEVAALAGIGSSWYIALEQGRAARPSDQVLYDLAAALRLTSAERAHLFFLAGRPAPSETPPAPAPISPALRSLLDALQPMPAVITDRRRWDWVAWNPAADALFGFDPADRLRPRNGLRRFFTDKKFSPADQWERSARLLAARFRAQNAHSTNEPWFKEFIQEMSAASEDFRRVWRLHEVADPAETAYVMSHERIGLIEVKLLVLETVAMPGAWLLTFLLDPAVAEKLNRPGA